MILWRWLLPCPRRPACSKVFSSDCRIPARLLRMMTTKYSSSGVPSVRFCRTGTERRCFGVAAPSDPPPAVTPAEPAREPGAGGPAGKRGEEAAPARLFRDAGDERSKIGKMPKWSRSGKDGRIRDTWLTGSSRAGHGRTSGKLSGAASEQVKAVNVLINRWPYRTDMDNTWGVAGLLGDARGVLSKVGRLRFAIAKYFALRDLEPLPRCVSSC